MKIQPIFVCLIFKTLRFGWYCLSSLMILIGVLNFGSIPMAISGVGVVIGDSQFLFHVLPVFFIKHCYKLCIQRQMAVR